MKKIVITAILFFSWELNAQVALPTFQGVQAASEVALYSFSSHTFTNSSATGNTGPTLANCKSSYNTSWENDTDLFNVQTQGIQEWTVPASGTYRITAKGASGGAYGGSGSSQGYPGAGATVVGDISLTLGTVLKIVVGQKPTSTSSDYKSGSAGGGASWVYTGSIGGNGLIVVAGGGGGTGHGSSSNNLAGNGKGGNDANTSNESTNGEYFGENQRRGRGSSGNLGTGYGGQKTAGVTTYNGGGGGAGWLGDGQDYTNYGRGGDRFVGGISEDGASMYGGFGGGGGSGGNGNAGGGGGGYTGGGAGYGFDTVSGYSSKSWGGGGGGGSYASSSMSSVTMTEGDSGIDQDDVDNGSVIIARQ